MRFSAQGRYYRYWLNQAKIAMPCEEGRITHPGRTLNLQAMQEAALFLQGEQDYSLFRSSECQAQHARRCMHGCRVWAFDEAWIAVDVVANAFLHHMVRFIVGALVQVGLERISPNALKALMDEKVRPPWIACMPAHGLYFLHAFYPERFGLQQPPLKDPMTGQPIDVDQWQQAVELGYQRPFSA